MKETLAECLAMRGYSVKVNGDSLKINQEWNTMKLTATVDKQGKGLEYDVSYKILALILAVILITIPILEVGLYLHYTGAKRERLSNLYTAIENWRRI